MGFEVQAVFVIEVLGRPAEHITMALNTLIEQLAGEKDIELANKKIFPPKPTENMFLTFAEVEVRAKNLSRIAELCFTYMPSSVEIVHPSDLKFNLNDANAMLNLLVARLHQYDAIAKKINVENAILQRQLQTLLQRQAKDVQPAVKKEKRQKEKRGKKKR
jgi:archaellin